MADVNANIGINLETSAALAQLKDLQRQLAIFNTSISKTTATAISGQKKLASNLINSINDTGKFVAQLRTVDTTVESFSKNLEKNKFSIKEYFKFAGASTKTFGASFRSEFDTINKVAEDRVKRLQTQYIKLGRSASGTMEAISVMPKSLDMGNYSVQMQMAAQRQALFNQLVKQGSTNLINFGKNTQWAGRQLMVGFTIPLMILGSTASKTFMEMEQAAIAFRKVYGDLFTPEPEREQALQSIEELGRMFTKYGIAVKDTLGLAADAAAAGFAGLDLQRQTTEATRLSVLGQIDTQKALETTIALQNAFKISSEDLAGSINFLNAVENQTVLSLDDITQAVPRVGPIIEQLGGNVKDLAFFLTAMKEGGVSAAQGANALKSGLASLIAPSEKSAAALMNYGININKIVESNQGNLRETVVEFAQALDTLDPLNRSRAIEQLFGKFQFARISALFNNITTSGTQASRVLDLSSASLEELASVAESELGVVSESTSVKFKAAMEELRLSLLPIGEEFLKAATPIVEFISGIIERFGNLSDGTKKTITIMIAAIGGLAPIVLMSFGLLNNLIGNAIKFALTLRQGYLKLTGQSSVLSQQTNFLADAQIDALAAAHSLNQSHAGLTQVFNVEAGALKQLIAAYQNATKAAQNFANVNRNMMAPGFNPNVLGPNPRRYNKGVVIVPGNGNDDTVPAMLTPGESVIPKEMTKRYAPLIEGMISGNIPGYRNGRVGSTGNKAFRLQDSYDLGHFAAPTSVSRSELLELAKNAIPSVQRKIEELVSATSNGLNKFFDVFSNQVVVQSQELNQKLNLGSAPLEMFKKEALNPTGAYNAPILAKMKTAGASQEELENAVMQLSKEMEQGISDLGNITEVTAETVDKITQAAYEKVSETNKQVNAAYEEMKKPSTIKEQFGQGTSTGSRLALRDSYTSKTNRTRTNQMLQTLEPGRFPTQQAGLFTVEAAQQAGFKDAEAIRKVYQQLDITARKEVDKLVKNTKAMSSQVRVEAEKAGIDIGLYTVKGISKGVKSSSPSKEAITIGQNVAKGLEIGMQQGKPGVTKAGNQLRDAAITSSGLIIPGGSASLASGGSGGIIPPQTTNPGFANDENRARQQNTKAIMTGTDRLQSMNRLMMSGSFALTSIAGAGSFAGGALGEFSNNVFKVSGLLFGLQAIIQLLTDQMLAQIVANRFRGAQVAARGAGMFGAGLASRGGILGNIAKVAIGIGKFIGPFGALTAVVAGAYAVWRVVKKQREQEREAIEGLGNAAKLTAEQVKTLGDFFGVVPQKLPSELSSGLFVTSAQERTQLEDLKENEKFQEDFRKTINTLKTATNAQTELTLQTLGLELSARGFATEQIDLIVKAIQEEAGKTDLVIEFKNFDIDNYMKDFDKVTQRFENQVSKQAERFVEKTANVRNKKTRQVDTVTFKEFLPPTEQYKKFANAFGTNFANAFDSISGRIRNGVIDVEQYKKEVGKLTSGFDDLSQAAKQVAIAKMIKDQDKATQDAINAVKNERDQVLLLTAAYLGLNVAKESAILARSNVTDAKDLKDYYGTQSSLQDRINKQLEAFNKANAAALKGTGKGTGDANKEMSDFDKKIKETLERLKNLKDASINTAGGMKELVKAIGRSGTGLNKFNGIAQQMLNMGKVGLNREFIDYVTSLDQESQKSFISIEKGMVKLTAAGRRLNKALNQIVINDAQKKYQEETKALQGQVIAFNRLRAAGLSTAQALEMVADANFALALSSAKTSDDLKVLINDFIEYKNALEAFENLDPEAVLNKEIDSALELLDLQEEAIRLEFEPQIENQQDLVDAAQDLVESIQEEIDAIQLTIEADRRNIEINYDRPIEALQREANILSNELTLLDREANKINERYDKQAEALDKIFEINQDIIAQEKSKVSLADALTKGDISAAAQAMQEIRATQATARQNSMTNSLDRSRETELNNLRSATGKTRLEIEERQFEIGQETFKLEQAKLVLLDRIRTKEDEIYLIQTTRLRDAENALKAQQKILEGIEKKYDDALRKIQDQRRELEKVRNAMELAKLEGVKFEDQMKKIKDLVADIKKQWDDIKSKDIEMRVHKICTEEGCDCGDSGGSGGKEGSDGTNNTKPKTTPKTTKESKTTDDLGYSRESTTDNIVDAYKDAMQYLDDSFRGVGPSGYEYNPTAAEIGAANAANQDAAQAARAAEKAAAKAKADGAVARAKNAKEIANVVKQESAAAARGGSMPVSAAARAAAEAARLAKEEEERRKKEQANKNAAMYRQAQSVNRKYMGGIIKGYAAGGMVRVPPAEPPPAQTMNMGGVVPKYMPMGGLVPYMNMGGIFKPKGTDTVPAMLTPGEFVIRKYAVKDFGLDRLKAINSGTYNDGSVYNYNLNLNVKSDANADDIAQTVISQIKRIEGQRIRGNRF